MCGSIVCMAAVLLGIDARWPPLPGGGLEYVIQIEPYVLDRLKSGDVKAIESDVPSFLQDVRAYRITAGTERLAEDAPGAEVSSPILSGVDTGWIALPEGGVQCLLLIEPKVVDELKKAGRAIQGRIPPEVKNVRTYKVAVGERKRPPSPPPVDPRETPEMPKSASPPLPQRAAPPGLPSEPPKLAPDRTAKRITAQQAGHVEPVDPTPDPAPPSEDGPRLLLTLALFGLFASLGGNVFLLWVARDFRKRYRALVQRMGDAAIDQ